MQHRPHRLFVTGTDTGVGKTRIACALLAALRQRGHHVTALKPIETGCRSDGGRLIAEDGLRLARAAGGLDVDRVCPIRFAPPTSPAAAAAITGHAIDLSEIDRAIDGLAPGMEAILVEGAGGLLVPIADDFTMADLAVRIGAPLLIVGRAGLGTINHTLLTIEAARARGLSIAGVILNRLAPISGIDEPSNPDLIKRFGDVEILGTLPYAPHDPSHEELAQLAEENIALDHLWTALAGEG